MKFSYISIGAGITGIETIHAIIKRILKNKNFPRKKISIGVIDKDPKNIPGGVGYGFNISKYGFFNNPLRLSPNEFVNWIRKKAVKKKIIEYLKTHGGYTGKIWVRNNKKTLFSKDKKKFDELYIPRAILNIWMEEKLSLILKKINKNKLNIDISFFKGEVIKLQEKGDYKKLFFKNNSCKKLSYEITENSFKKFFFQEKKEFRSIYSNILNIGLGLPPPKQLASKKAQQSNSYIWDFYSEGSTSALLNKISKYKKNKKIILYFIGYKAGLLESLPELSEFIKRKKIKIKIICSSKNLKSIKKAEPTNNKTKYILNIFKKRNLSKIDTAKKLYKSILYEFNIALQKNYNRYDAWTAILKNNILDKCIDNFNNAQNNIYSKVYHNKIRNMTRFTYPETIKARDILIERKILTTNKEVVKKVDIYKKKLIVKTNDNKKKLKKYLCDIVINVSGPLNVVNIKNEIPIINHLKSKGAKISAGGFLVGSNFNIKGVKNIYTSGILATNFNPDRKTIFNAILKNSKVVGKKVARILTQL